MRRLFYIPVLALLACQPSSANIYGPDAGGDADAGVGADAGPHVSDGGLQEGGPGDGGTKPDAGEACGFFTLTIRDFSDQHPDFEEPTYASGKGIVRPELGPDQKPVYAHDAGLLGMVHSPESFAQWYNDVPNINIKFLKQIELTPLDGGVFSFASNKFFPINNEGFGNEGRLYNYHFTTEFHGTFTYRGGEVFEFEGDDDLFVFVNGRLGIDLGGVHPSQSASIDFDARASEFGIVPGNVYPLDIFHAERHVAQSNFKIVTTIDCIKTVTIN